MFHGVNQSWVGIRPGLHKGLLFWVFSDAVFLHRFFFSEIPFVIEDVPDVTSSNNPTFAISLILANEFAWGESLVKPEDIHSLNSMFWSLYSHTPMVGMWSYHLLSPQKVSIVGYWCRELCRIVLTLCIKSLNESDYSLNFNANV